MTDKNETAGGRGAREARIRQGRMRGGAITMAVGLVVTFGAATIAPGGGYIVGWGIVVLGALFFLLGLSDWLLTQSPGIFGRGKSVSAPRQAPVSERTEIGKDELRAAEVGLRRLGGRHNGRNFVHWMVANRKLEAAKEASDWNGMKSLYAEMARLLFEDGKHHIDAAIAAQTSELRAFVPFGVDEVEVSTGGESSCRQCSTLQGERLTVSEAIERMPLPVRNCTNQARQKGTPGWCRCSYLAVLDK